MPKLYEYNMNQKYKKISCVNFNEVLSQKLSKFYDTTKIPKINIRKIKIKSQILFQISYDKEKLILYLTRKRLVNICARYVKNVIICLKIMSRKKLKIVVIKI